MLQFSDSETQRLLRTTARSFLANAYPWERLYRIESGQEQMTGPDLDEMADLGWFDLLAADGDGASLLDTAVVIEEFGYAGVPSPVAPMNIAPFLISIAGGLEAVTKRCTISEGARLRADKSSVAISNGVANGMLPLVPFAQQNDDVPFAELSDDVLAPATIDGEAALAVVSFVGARAAPLAVLDRRCYSNVTFTNAPATVVAQGDRARELHEQLDALSTAFGLIELSGMMQRIMEMTVQHISTRQQFGQPIGKFQAARHRAAEMLMQVDTTRWAAYHALWRFQQDPNDTDEIWLAKHWAVRAVDRVFQNSHMLHGGVGVGMEHPLHLFTQGMAAFAVRGGTMSEMVQRTLQSLRSEPIAEAAR